MVCAPRRPWKLKIVIYVRLQKEVKAYLLAVASFLIEHMPHPSGWPEKSLILQPVRLLHTHRLHSLVEQHCKEDWEPVGCHSTELMEMWFAGSEGRAWGRSYWDGPHVDFQESPKHPTHEACILHVFLHPLQSISYTNKHLLSAAWLMIYSCRASLFKFSLFN